MLKRKNILEGGKFRGETLKEIEEWISLKGDDLKSAEGNLIDTR